MAARAKSPQAAAAEEKALALIRPRLALMIEAFNDEEGNKLPGLAVYLGLKLSGIWDRYRNGCNRRGHAKQDDPIEALSPSEQYDAQVKDLYTRALAGDTQAKKLWFELSPVTTTDQTFNISVNIKDYRIKDESLKNILQAAEPQVVHDALSGILLRMDLDEAPHELRAMLKSFDNKFQHWAAAAYQPKNA